MQKKKKKNAKQNLANSMWREDLKSCTYTSRSRSRSVTNVFMKTSQYSQENTPVGFSF